MFQYTEDAKNNFPMPDGLSVAECMAYQSVAMLTQRFKTKAIGAEQAKNEFNKIMMAFERAESDARFQRLCAELWKAIEQSACEFNKTESIESARKMRDTIYGFNRRI